MHRIDYEMMIKAFENSDTIALIGNVDIQTLRNNSVETLYYEFPLIERVVLEIYKMLPLSDVEQYTQGTMRTILEIINKDSNNYFPDNLIKVLQKYYGSNGLRNKLFHIKDDTGTMKFEHDELDYKEIKYALMQLIYILRETCGKYQFEKIGNIKLI